jgi:formylglycine-generating enzyme required for sulfatase activity
MVRIIVLLAVMLLPGAAARAEARIALLIGNQAYNPKVGPLKTPLNDISLIGTTLKQLGFKVTIIRDGDYKAIDTGIKRYIRAVRREGQGAISFLYYSGHGAADPETKINYLIPVDVANADDEDLWSNSINLNNVVEELRAEAPGATHYVVFDACRNELNLTRRGQKALAEKGFVPIGYTPGVMIAYATAPGQTASDTGSGAGVYARALADELVKPGVDSMLVFTRVARQVLREIGQDPFLSASTMPEIYFAGEASISNPPVTMQKQPQVPVPAKRCEGVEVEVGNAQNCIKPSSGKSTWFIDCDGCPEMIVIPAGEYMMGSPVNEIARADDEGPRHTVSISRPFAVGRFAVTFKEWDLCRKEGGCNDYRPDDRSWGRDKRPVISVSWNDTQLYIVWLSKRTGKTYRLLTEAEREYVARAGSTTPFWWGTSIAPTQANYIGNLTYGGGRPGDNRKKTVAVDTFQPNPWGLYQVHGNVWEWVEDCWNGSYSGAPIDGSAWLTGNCQRRVLRGGSWGNNPRNLRSAVRYALPIDHDDSFGFRVARTL